MYENIMDEIPNLPNQSVELRLEYFVYYSKTGKAIPGIEKRKKPNVPKSNTGPIYCYVGVPQAFRPFLVKHNVFPNRVWTAIMPSNVPNDIEVRWLKLCQDNSLIPARIDVEKVAKRRILDLPMLKTQTHKLYITLLCFRYSREMPNLVNTIVLLKEKYPEINFINLLVTASVIKRARSGHSIVPMPTLNYYSKVDLTKSEKIEHFKSMVRSIIGLKEVIKDKKTRIISEVLKDPLEYQCPSWSCESTIKVLYDKVCNSWILSKSVEEKSKYDNLFKNLTITKLLTEI